MEAFVSQLNSSLQEGIKRDFQVQQTVLPFFEYLDEVTKHPKRHVRNSARYFADCIEHFGSYSVSLPFGSYTRFNVFDAPYDEGQTKVMGQEKVQYEIVRILRNFVKSGKIDRLILLHGPNGSAKTSIVHALISAAEAYSHTEEGAIYQFNWIFPRKEIAGKSLGFQGQGGTPSDSYALLENDAIASTLPCDQKDHPLLLLSKSYRRVMFKHFVQDGSWEKEDTIPEVLVSGDLSAKNRKIYDALLANYGGNVLEVLKHVQVQRFYFSRRYRRGVATVEPQMSVDGHIKQITMDQSLADLPPTMQHLNLYQSGGALSQANRGLIEYSDLLKRPIESWKYLLVATEQAQVNMDVLLMFLDVVMMASSNELHLASFREYPDWQSFKGRFELVKVPYLLKYSDELAIYENQIPRVLVGMHTAPHALGLAARWAVLTRLEPPTPEKYGPEIRELVRTLTPMEKLELYDTGATPERLSQKEAKNLRMLAPTIFNEKLDDVDYEGRYGASPREVRMLLLNASQDKSYDHLSPIAVLKELRLLVRERSSYDFLRRESQRGFRDASKYVDLVERYYIKKLDEEIRSAMGLISANSHLDLFEKYVRHVSAWTKKEKILDPGIDKMVEPDQKLMREIERVLVARAESSEDFRRALIAQIGAFRLEHPAQKVDYALLFGNYLRRIKDDYYERQKITVGKILEAYLLYFGDDEEEKNRLDKKTAEQVLLLKENLCALGYNDESAKHAVAFLKKARG